MGRIAVMGPQGDIAIEWDPSDGESVKKAKEEWKTLKDQGFDFFVDGKQVKRFSKKLSKVVAAPGVRKKQDKKTGKRPKAMAGGPRAERIL